MLDVRDSPGEPAAVITIREVAAACDFRDALARAGSGGLELLEKRLLREHRNRARPTVALPEPLKAQRPQRES
jgi:hypothetical protein